MRKSEVPSSEGKPKPKLHLHHDSGAAEAVRAGEAQRRAGHAVHDWLHSEQRGSHH